MDPILWPRKNAHQIRDSRDSRARAILLISDFWDPKFSNAHKILPLGARDQFFFLNDNHGLFFHAMCFLNQISAQALKISRMPGGTLALRR